MQGVQHVLCIGVRDLIAPDGEIEITGIAAIAWYNGHRKDSVIGRAATGFPTNQIIRGQKFLASVFVQLAEHGSVFHVMAIDQQIAVQSKVSLPV